VAKRSGTVGAPSDGVSSRRDQNARVSFFDPGNQAALDRLITSVPNEADGEEETAQAMMSNVEEMIEGYEWAIDDVIGRKSARGAADLIEARLLDELLALEKVLFNCVAVNRWCNINYRLTFTPSLSLMIS
jgi:hypothetical protein